MYDHTTVQGATFNMRGLILAGTRRCALETCGKKKMRSPLLGLAKFILLWCYLKVCGEAESHDLLERP